jgi:FkbM family methyltransferase
LSGLVSRAPLGAAKSLAARALCHPIVGTIVGRWYKDEIPDRRGCTIRTPPPVAPAVKAMLFWKMYESAELRFVEAHLRSDLDVLEVGASIGVVGAHIARRLGEKRKLVCVEANPSLMSILEENVRSNAPRATLSFKNAAISYSGAPDVELTLGKTNLGGAVGKDGDRRVKVKAMTVSEILREESLGDFCLVSDIEGAESGIIRQDREALERCKQIIIELHDTAVDGQRVTFSDLASWVVAAGFRTKAQYGPVYVFERA